MKAGPVKGAPKAEGRRITTVQENATPSVAVASRGQRKRVIVNEDIEQFE